MSVIVENPSIGTAKSYCGQQADLIARNTTEGGRSAADFLLEHGKQWGPRIPLPKGVRKGKVRMCFQNAFELAIRNPDEYRYVEGYATRIIPTQHAWCVDKAGQVVERTWPVDKYTTDDYFGVEVPMPLLIKIGLKIGQYGVFVEWAQWEDVRKMLEEYVQVYA